MALLVDTSIFVEAERRRLSVADIIRTLSPEEQIVMSAMTLAELLVGIPAAESPSRREDRTSFIDSISSRVESLPFDTDVARVYAEAWAALRHGGNLIPVHDLIIGCTAVAHGLDVLTQNVRDFSRIPGLTARQPSW